tara:strand:- start:1762 stop:2883 length:1122 start_codon:yes stop_codon:yes gene_type:complete
MIIGIVCYPTFGGSGVLATELGVELSRKGHEIHFITYNQPVKLELFSNKVHFHEVEVPNYPLFHYPPYELALSSRLVGIVNKYKIDILHVHYAIPHAYAALMAKQMLNSMGIKIPVVTTLHGTDITLVGSNPSYKTAVEYSINNSDYVTAVSQSLKSDTLSLFEIEKDIKVISNFVNLEKYNSRSSKTNLLNNNHKIITHVSNFRKVKRIMDVIDIFDGIQKEIPAKLLMIGDGPEKNKAEKKAKRLGIKDKVIFFGKSTEVNKILSFSDLFLLPSEIESFGLSALEAMAAKVPVISSNTGGIPEVNIDNFSGKISEIGNVKKMINDSIDILSDKKLHEIFKINARKRAEDFDIHKIVPEYEKVYDDLIKDKL